jgi:hypothetical protein
VLAVRSRSLAISACVGGGATLVAGALVWACLPALTLTEASSDAGEPFCGDGVISPALGEECDPGPDASPAVLAVCGKCKVLCSAPQFEDSVSHHCYLPLTGNWTLQDAGAACEKSASAHVVRFVSENEVSLVDQQPGTTYWVGLMQSSLVDSGRWYPSEETLEPGWTAACPGCFAQVDAGATQIPEVPVIGDAGHIERRCVEAQPGSSNPLWMQATCTDTIGALCEREPVGTHTYVCPQGACFTVAATWSEKSYVLLAAPSSASAAPGACASIDAGLVVFESREEREQVGDEIGRQSVLDAGSDFWIGLSQGDAGVWKWARPDAGLKPQPWGIGEPNADAAPNARAFVLVQVGLLDSQLARAQVDAGEIHYDLCEVR